LQAATMSLLTELETFLTVVLQICRAYGAAVIPFRVVCAFHGFPVTAHIFLAGRGG
jgi:hypothetical protein